jgi:hypothetical protein
VSAVTNVAPERAHELAATCGARAVVSVASQLEEVDAVCVCSLPTFHREHVLAAVAAGKHVFNDVAAAGVHRRGPSPTRRRARPLPLRVRSRLVGMTTELVAEIDVLRMRRLPWTTTCRW